MKKLSPSEKEALRQKLREHHESKLMRAAKEADRGYQADSLMGATAEAGPKRGRLGRRIGNPALNSRTFAGFEGIAEIEDVMSIRGTVNKIALLLSLAFISAAWTWILSYRFASTGAVIPWLVGGAIGGFVVGLVTVSKKSWAAITAPIYAVLEGLVLGGLSSLFEARFPGIVIQAVGLTFGTLFCLLVLYKSGIVMVTANFKRGIVAATGAIALVYIATLLLGLFGASVPYIHEGGLIGIGFSLFVILIAALNLVLDFDFIEKGVASGAPRYMEWYAAFGLMVTLIWLYIEILELLAEMQDDD